jgi:AraC-like DNA-binding protein
LTNKLSYRLRDSIPSRTSGDNVLSLQAIRVEGDLRPSYNFDIHGTEVGIIGDGQPDLYCLVTMLSGTLEMVDGPNGSGAAHGKRALIFQGVPGMRFLTSDGSARLALWLDAARLERALQARLGEPPCQRLEFSPGIDWTAAPAKAVWRAIAYLIEELRDPQGLTTDPIALETFTDSLLQLILTRFEHNYTARLERPFRPAIPGLLRRAEAFMHAAADQPITLADVAAAAGCGMVTLHTTFRRFRDTTPLAALHDIRLQHVREALRVAGDEEVTREIARRFGFTNPSRFIAAYRKRFGEHPKETRRSSR